MSTEKHNETLADEQREFDQALEVNLITLNEAVTANENKKVDQVLDKIDQLVKISFPNLGIDEIDTKNILLLFLANNPNSSRVMQKLLDQGADIDITNKSGMTALHIAVDKGNGSVVDMLLNNGAKVNTQDDSSETPLHSIAAKEDAYYMILEKLLKGGANIEIKDIDGKTALHIAVEERKFSLVGTLLKHQANVNTYDNKGVALLHSVLAEGKSDIRAMILFETLLDKADINLKSLYGMTALHIAILTENFNAAEALLEKQANVNIKDDNGIAPLHMLAAIKDTNWLNLLIKLLEKADLKLQDFNGMTALHIALAQKNFDAVNLLIDKQEKINIPDNNGITPLHMVAEKDKYITSSLTKLIEKSDVNQKDLKGRTALRIAVDNENLKVMDLLLANQAEIDTQDIDGVTPLHSVAAKGSKCNILILIKLLGIADINIKDFKGVTPFYSAMQNWSGFDNVQQYYGLRLREKDELAMSEKDLAILQEENKEDFPIVYFQLLKKNPDVNVRALDGSSVLHIAANKFNEEFHSDKLIVSLYNIFQELIKQGANVNCQDAAKNTPLHVVMLALKQKLNTVEDDSEISKYFKFIKVLLTKEVKLNIHNTAGQTPISLLTEMVAAAYPGVDEMKKIFGSGGKIAAKMSFFQSVENTAEKTSEPSDLLEESLAINNFKS